MLVISVNRHLPALEGLRILLSVLDNGAISAVKENVSPEKMTGCEVGVAYQVEHDLVEVTEGELAWMRVDWYPWSGMVGVEDRRL